MMIDDESFAAQFGGARFQICAVFPHFLALGQIEQVIIARHPAVRDVHEQETRASHLRERFDVVQNSLIGRAVFKRNENTLIHREFIRQAGQGSRRRLDAPLRA